jgi:PAS domain S-box-containing protein
VPGRNLAGGGWIYNLGAPSHLAGCPSRKRFHTNDFAVTVPSACCAKPPPALLSSPDRPSDGREPKPFELMQSNPNDILSAGLQQIDSYAIACVEPGGRIVSWNLGAERLTGFPTGRAIGEGLAELLAEEEGALGDPYLYEVATRGGECGLWLRRENGSHFWAKLSAVSVPGTDPEAGGFTIVFRDATALKLAQDELERSRSLYEGILAIASDAVVCVDDTQRIFFFNEGAERIFGFTPQEVLGQPLEILIPDRFRSPHAAHVDAFGKSAVVSRVMGDRGQISGVRKSGEEFPAEASISKLDVGGRRIYTAVLRDVTDRRLGEEALARQAEELARSNAELEQFAYVASHDLQEPLRMVASYTQLLARRYGDKLDADAVEFIGFAVDGVKRMQALINDLLAFSRVGTRGGEFAPTSLESVLEKVLIALGPTIEETDAKITHDPLPVVHGDPNQIFQLLQNLVQNGIKFHVSDRRPHVHIGAGDAGSHWHFTVQDDGIGIAPEFQDRIFIIFQRLHSRSEFPGTGIGLAICKKIVERHGGRIWVESQVGEGSTFHFTLPKDREAA